MRHAAAVAPVVLLAALALPAPGPALTPYLVKDLDPTSLPAGSNPWGFRSLGSVAIFQAEEPDHGRELWRTDGTPEGTYRLTDACAGTCSTYFYYGFPTNNRLFFSLQTAPSTDKETWWTDGSVAGTRRLEFPAEIERVTEYDYMEGLHTLLFSGRNAASHASLWRSDGTATGATKLVDFQGTGSTGSASNFTAFGTRIMFSVRGTSGTNGLWITDGTSAGTKFIADPLQGQRYGVFPFVALGNRMFVEVVSENRGRELWVSNGTRSSTRKVRQYASSAAGVLTSWAALGNRVLFMFDNYAGREELWSSDGTGNGTRLLTAMVSTRFESYLPGADTVLGNRMIFLSDDGVHGIEPWTTDGTPAGTHLLADLCPGSCSSAWWPIVRGPGGVLYFSADDGSHGWELWRTDGTAAGTRMFKDLCAGACSSNAQPSSTYGSRLLFRADDPAGTDALWSTDGLPSHTIRLTTTYRRDDYTPDSSAMTAHGLVFPGAGATGNEPWHSNGRPAGTRPLADIDPSWLGGSNPTPFAAVGDRAFFFVSGADGTDLGASRGDETNTSILAHLPAHAHPCLDVYGQREVHAETTTLAFFAIASDDGPELWRSDGTATGTFSLGPSDCGFGGLAAVNDHVFFTANGKLHESDGSVTGTQPTAALGDVTVAIDRDAPVIAGKVVVRQTTGGNTTKWIATDGSPGGTVDLTDQGGVGCVTANGGKLLWVLRADAYSGPTTLAAGDASGAAPITISDLDLAPSEYVSTCQTAVAGPLTYFFLKIQGASRYANELWVTDGTANGTARVAADVRPDDAWRTPAPVGLGHSLYFLARGSGVSPELWISDGTAAGTGPTGVATQWGVIPQFAVFQGRLILDGTTADGLALWESDGTAAGTHALCKLPTDGSWPPRLVATTNRLFFRGLDVITGAELWALRPD